MRTCNICVLHALFVLLLSSLTANFFCHSTRLWADIEKGSLIHQVRVKPDKQPRGGGKML